MKKIPMLLMLLGNSLFSVAQNGTTIQFSVDVTALKDVKNLGIRGSVPPLSWETTYYLKDEDNDGIFKGEITFPEGTNPVLEYKYVYGNKKPTWELGKQNRVALLNNKSTRPIDVWNIPNQFDINQLPLLSAEKLSADFLILKSALLEIHPGLYRYNSVNDIDSIFDYFQSVFSKPQSYQEAFLNFTKLTSAIRCGHTYPNFYNQSTLIKEVVLDQPDKLPFTFRVIDEKILLTACVADQENFPPGTEIVAIDGVPTATLLKATANLVKADGANDAKRYADLNTFGAAATFEMFDCYFPLLYPPDHQQYLVSVKKPGSATVEDVTIKTISRTDRTKALSKKHADNATMAGDLWKLEFWNNSTAYLQLGTFDVFQLSFDWKKYLKATFNDIKKKQIKNLVIDIRWNEGGQDEVLLLLGQYITPKPIVIPERKELVRYSTLSPKLKPFLYTWNNDYFDLSQKVTPYNTDYFLLKEAQNTEVKPSENAFDGKVYLLVNAANSSATFYFAEIAQTNRLATLVGETTGGSQKGLNAGTLFFLRLPESQIEIDIPIVGTFSEDKPGGGIQPDVIVPATVEEVTRGEDNVILSTKALIARQSN